MTRAKAPLVALVLRLLHLQEGAQWLADHGVEPTVRPIVDEPPTPADSRSGSRKSGRSVRKWLNTSGQSYRALGRRRSTPRATPR